MDSSYDEAGEIPGMGYGKDGPFGASLDEPEEAFGTEIGMDEGNISGFVGAEPGGGMEVSGETGGITGMQDGGQEAEPGAGMADTGILSYDSESAHTTGMIIRNPHMMAAPYASQAEYPVSAMAGPTRVMTPAPITCPMDRAYSSGFLRIPGGGAGTYVTLLLSFCITNPPFMNFLSIYSLVR